MRWFLRAVLFVGVLCTARSQDPEPTLTILARSTIYNIDETKAIFCEGHNLVEPIQWLRPTGEVVGVRSTKNNRIFVEQKDNGAVVPLIIHRIALEDAGNWTCRSGDLNETREFIVGQKVQFTVKNMSVEEEEGNSIKLPCEAVGYPDPVVAWYKEKQLIKEQSKKYIIKPDHSLEIRKLNHADVGTYTCKVRQKVLSHYTEKTIQLSVQHKPVIIDKFNRIIVGIKYKTEEVYAILNDTKNVTCRSIANPPPTYTWNRRHDGYDDSPITDPDTVMTSEDGTSSVLVLRLYNTSYFGEYKCTVSNRKGTESIIYDVSAGTKPDPPDFVSLVSVNVTEVTFNVSCSNCTYPSAKADSVTLDPAIILGYSFQFVKETPGYDPDWTASTIIEVDVAYNSTLYTVGPLKNGTKYHVQVRTRNAAGYSEWVDIPGIVATLNNAIKLAGTVLLVFVAILVPRLY